MNNNQIYFPGWIKIMSHLWICLTWCSLDMSYHEFEIVNSLIKTLKKGERYLSYRFTFLSTINHKNILLLNFNLERNFFRFNLWNTRSLIEMKSSSFFSVKWTETCPRRDDGKYETFFQGGVYLLHLPLIRDHLF